MLDVTLIILCAGNSSRFEHKAKKQWLRTDNHPLWLNVTKKMSEYADFDKIIITSSKNELSYMKNFSDDYCFIAGGNTRQESIVNSLKEVSTSHVMISDVARACIPKSVIIDLLENKNHADCIVPVLNVSDTVIYDENTINRDSVKLIQTPQLSNTEVLRNSLKTNIEHTDDSSAIKANNGTIKYIQGSTKSKKLTFGNEIDELACLKTPSNNFFTGTGFDIHQFEDNKEMYLGGIKLPVDYGFKAHSDGDVLIHSVIDALLGAAGAGDIGEFFPDTDEQYKGIDSKVLLEKIVEFIYNVGYEIVNIDLTIIAQKPKINPHKQEIKSSIAKLLGIEKQFVNIKATTAEKMGFIGRSEGVAVQSIATLKYYNWTKK
ncbi:bifunctional 2-C-methyl-D-erythritol 4-phosphate cytidylyltransferase/2-C-methyl-D-erythritol 2,4-cyclodiphosphate synthase [Poseidonibacter lekithochrous]|uniref:bifunctional 2-C-methyl-D-erythritol 4-phosphate cytidylyltransferase/2-C-methyl-D-erythritol 2,4-cyclodiphosphate synthase n=1 Tax=Poseidonibacter TaxID=2321187 RepID=UPI001C08E947|nr:MULTISPECIES: bifunctional 2-C-methyl-D-erythritol 4-phosphate cytidylyltransferase/2-C-methyl-D-erythritol 2,4-cyclodiphosphate synthase [Poseidonibacter]MBU3014396.1 bifunctional 2-C-methyl-D-erythritol 4-phosphate cytidylyltransferase/2-C-methyl-D-erythritol 2,4-cyclodiphosphate synthase [Poseidonibacter lekithochrous]MDO6827694.1 bifunctional 2-C-methyl-D-erythritol 4-phosphate cytidylyltransferase/2-C-methyl-D-erythritol 2,4-cyclodiphosphate synthase [Poseidonibacter sp. 1_MG-2023]